MPLFHREFWQDLRGSFGRGPKWTLCNFKCFEISMWSHLSGATTSIWAMDLCKALNVCDIDVVAPTRCNYINMGYDEFGGPPSKRTPKIPPKFPMKLRHIFFDFFGVCGCVASLCVWVVWSLNVEVAVCFVVLGCTCFVMHLNITTP